MTTPAPQREAEASAAELGFDLLVASNFATRFARANLRQRDVMRLRELLQRLEPGMAPPVFTEWLDDLAHWLRSTRRVPEQREGEATHLARLRTFFEALELLPRQLELMRAGVAQLFARSRAVSLFTDVGVPSRQGFFSEMIDRLSRSVLPDPPVDDELGELLSRLFETARSVQWFEALPAAELGRLFSLLAVPGGSGLDPLRRDMAEAAVLLAMRVSHHGLANDVRYRTPKVALEASPFFRLPDAVRAAVGLAGAQKSGGGDACREVIAACRKLTQEAEDSLERTGVSVDLVYRLDLVRRQLDRLYTLLGLVAPSSGAVTPGASSRLLLVLIRGARRDRSVVDLFRTSTRLLARRVVDAAAHSGGHYVTRSGKELHQLFGSAAGGGFVAAFTSLLKFVFGWAGLAPFWEGFLFSVNYAGSFITMQLLGFTLASKQPSMTAAHLARAMEQSQGPDGLQPLTHEVARAVRSQLAATLGNLGMILPTAVAVDLAVQGLSGHSVLDPAKADSVIAAHHPFTTGLVPGAVLTGVALWLASLSAGTLENWAVFRRLPQAIASQQLLRAVFGADRARRFSQWLLKNLSGFGGNVALGLQMGLVPTVGAFFGVPLQLPHVTVATGQLVFAGMARGPFDVLQADFAWACLGIAFVGAMNFGVSFALALWVALRATEGGTLAVLGVARSVFRLFLARPLDFVRAPPSEEEPPHASDSSTRNPP